MKGSDAFKRSTRVWLPEHVRLLIERAFLEFPDRSSAETHRNVATLVRKVHPALPMSERELIVTIARQAQQP